MTGNVAEQRYVDQGLLARAVAHLAGPDATVLAVRTLPINAGVSGVAVRRLAVQVAAAGVLHVVVKPCSRQERVTLALLDGLRSVPRVFVDETSRAALEDVVMLDAGETLLGFDERAKRLAALALSEVHARFLGRHQELAALAPLTQDYLEEFIVAGCWRPAWQRAVTDDYHGHVFDTGDRAVVIDWGQARRAPLFLDLGDTFDTPVSGRIYQQALAARGVLLGDDVFSRGHGLSLRFAGIRYLWWWLDSWLADPQDWNRSGLVRTLAMAAGTAALPIE
ncbi:MAG TPA: hypothetical protein VF635_10025 [Propionibacteriaceae bacterium]